MTEVRHILRVASFAAMLAVAASPVFAAGPYDGVWVVDVPSSAGSGTHGGAPACPALRFPVEIKDSVVTGSLERVGTGNIVGSGYDRNARPINGTVTPDGTVTGEWLNYHAAGRLSGTTGVVTIQGACGPREASLVRVK
jgi:hypothetical protein